jgi:hypothetical protein
MVPGPVGGAMVSVAGPSAYVHGLGDPGLSATVNVYGAPGLKAKEYARHDVATNVGLQLRTTFPLGQYDPDDPASMGSNQFKFRLALPITQAFSAWVPGRRVALDVMPSVVFATTNEDYLGQEVKPDPTFAVEAHLSRDMTKKAFLSLDYAFLHGGAATYSDKDTGAVLRESDAMDAHLLGLTVNYTINDNLQLFLTHMQTLKADDDDPVVLQGSLFKLTLSWAWHAVLQRARDFHG